MPHRILARWKMAPMLTLIGAAILLAAGIFTAIYQQNLYTAQKTREVTVQAQILAASVTAALDFNDQDAAQEYVNALKANPEVQAAGVYNTDGDLVANYVRPVTAPLPAKMRDNFVRVEADHVVVSVPVMREGARLGTVYVRSNIDT